MVHSLCYAGLGAAYFAQRTFDQVICVHSCAGRVSLWTQKRLVDVCARDLVCMHVIGCVFEWLAGASEWLAVYVSVCECMYV